MNVLAWTLALGVPTFLAFTIWAFHHTHARGHCGYSGCQSDLKENQP